MRFYFDNLTIGYDKTVVQSGLEAQALSGTMVCLLGRNGSGKSTLLRTLAGLQKPLSGKICITEADGTDVEISSLSASKRALIISLVLTDHVSLESTKVSDVVAMGRYQHTSFLGELSAHDKEIINNALRDVAAEDKKDCFFNELSDGEKQRILIAKALSQQTPIILLDEPTSFLDLPNRIKIMSLLKNLAKEQNKIIIISTHELDLALQIADKIWLLDGQENSRNLHIGSSKELLDNGIFMKVFEDENFTLVNQNGQVRVEVGNGEG